MSASTVYLKINLFLLEFEDIKVWTSSLKRTIATAANINAAERKLFSCLDELNAGRYDGVTFDDVEALYPEEYEKRKKDKLNYRYPEGNTFNDFWLFGCKQTN